MTELLHMHKFFEYKQYTYMVGYRDTTFSYKTNYTYYIYTSVNPKLTIEETAILYEEAGDFHGGVTYCRRITEEFRDQPKEAWEQDDYYYKIGCDYSHAWDQGKQYSEASVCKDAENTIDLLIKAGLLE